MTDVLQHIIDALGLGVLYALIALGIALIFGIIGLANFAHGELIMLGAYMMVAFAGFGWAVAVIGAVVIAAIAALSMDRVAFRPIRGANPATLLMTSFAVSYLVQNIVLVTAGSRAQAVSSLPAKIDTNVELGSLRVPLVTLLTLGIGALLMGALALFLKRTSLGIQMRAAAEDFRMARLLGVRANLVIAVAFALSGLLAGVAAVLIVFQTATVSPQMGSLYVLIGFAATIIGGLGKLGGAVVGGLVLGIITEVLQATLPLELRLSRDAFVFGAVIVILVLRPQGLLGGNGQLERV